MSVNVSLEEVERVAALARLRLNREELKRLSGQLSRILTYMEDLNAVETEGIQVTAGGVNVLRDDEIRPSLSQAQALGNAPDAADGLFRVPQVISDR